MHVQPSATGNGTVVTEFKAGAIAGAWMPEPYETEMLQAGGHLLVNEGTLWPGGKWATTNVVVRTAFLQAHPATVQRFLQGLVDTLKYIQANPAAAQAAFNNQLRQPAGRQAAVDQGADPGLGQPDLHRRPAGFDPADPGGPRRGGRAAQAAQQPAAASTTSPRSTRCSAPPASRRWPGCDRPSTRNGRPEAR